MIATCGETRTIGESEQASRTPARRNIWHRFRRKPASHVMNFERLVGDEQDRDVTLQRCAVLHLQTLGKPDERPRTVPPGVCDQRALQNVHTMRARVCM